MRTIQNIKLIPIRDYLAHRGVHPKQENSRYGFYLSPLRKECDASFKVDYSQNVWYDFGIGRGGSIIDLVIEIENCNFQQAEERLQNDNISTSTFVTSPTLHTSASGLKVSEDYPLRHPALINYLDSRAIDASIAKKFCREVHYSVGERNYFAIGFRNDYGGWELRSERFKGCSTLKHITTIKSHDSLTLKIEKYQNNPFLYRKKHFHEEGNAIFLIASIPFVRNIAECLGDTNNFNKLTHLLHIKEDTRTLTTKDLEEMYKQILKDMDNLQLPNPNRSIYDLIIETASTIMNREEISMELDDKIVLAIVIRLTAEQYVIDKIQDNEFVQSITKNATNQLIHKYKEMYPENIDVIKVLNQVNIMTPENIHVNSFMYEPILDMSNHHLKTLYTNVIALQ